jgi:hypothetical protein
MSDKNFAAVSALLHFDGPDAATSIVDTTGNAWTAAGNAQLDTAQAKFGQSSLLLDSMSRVDATPSAGFTFGTSDYTIECFVHVPNTGINKTVFSHGSDYLVYINSTTCYLWNGSANIITGTGVVPINTWFHLAVARAGTALRMFIDGSQVGSTATNSTNFSTTNFVIGASVGGLVPFNGWIDELRVTKGLARYTAGFTPPANPFSSGKYLGVAGAGSQPVILSL